jgi:hypothetical protein
MLENPRISDYNWTSVRVKHITCRQRENVMSADNQQERLDERWLSGFVDGEGCFHVAINSLSKMTMKYQVLPEFRLVQHERDIEVLEKIRDFLGVGVVRRNHSDRYELRVRNLKELNILIKFFNRNRLMTKKKNDFELFKEIIFLMNNKEHLTLEGIEKIAVKANLMNRQNRKSLSGILRDYTPKQF